jgi:hypothetical protein
MVVVLVVMVVVVVVVEVAYWLRHFADSRKVQGSIPGGVAEYFVRGIRQSHVPGVDLI